MSDIEMDYLRAKSGCLGVHCTNIVELMNYWDHYGILLVKI